MQLLDEQDFVTVEQLVSAVEGVSESTIRRDLKAMADEGLLVLMRGGASYEPFAVLGERDHGRGGPFSFIIRDDHGLPAFDH